MLIEESIDIKKARVDDVVRCLKSKYMEVFLDSSTAFPQFTHRFNQEEQLKAERDLEGFIDETISRIEKSKKSGGGLAAEVEKLKASVKAFIARSLCSRGEESDIAFLDQFSDVGDEFVRKARAFDPRLGVSDIHQALRNVWIVNSFQVFLGKEVALTPSGFAYSLLYPYTDNYLDDPRVSQEMKVEFVQTLGRRLAGKEVQPIDSPLTNPFQLIGMIEREFPRQDYPHVFGSLLAIHDAQVEALAQQQGSRFLWPKDILEMSVEKGGTSVLADACVAAGVLEDRVGDFAFGFGVCLQLMDDLQDLEEDIARGHQTIMTASASGHDLDAKTNQLINFTTSIIDSASYFHPPQAKALLELSHKSCVTLILEAVARTSDRFPKSYLTALEALSPLRFAYLRSLKESLKEKSKRLGKFESVIAAGAF